MFKKWFKKLQDYLQPKKIQIPTYDELRHNTMEIREANFMHAFHMYQEHRREIKEIQKDSVICRIYIVQDDFGEPFTLGWSEHYPCKEPVYIILTNFA